MPLCDALVRGGLLTQRHQITSLETRDYRLSYGENPESLSHLGLIRHRVVSDRQTERRTDRIAIANTRSAVPAGTAVARKKISYLLRSFHQKCSACETENAPNLFSTRDPGGRAYDVPETSVVGWGWGRSHPDRPDSGCDLGAAKLTTHRRNGRWSVNDE